MICRRPGKESSSGPVHDHHACDSDVLKVFWSYCSEVGFVKSPVTINAASGYTVPFPARLYSHTVP